jgi:hypothetical protein
MGLLVTLLMFCLVSLCQGQQIADLAPEYRIRNRGGSCGHCSTAMHLKWLGLLNEGSDWWATYRGGEYFSRHLSRLRAKGIKFVATSDGDPRILEYSTWSRRGAVVYWPSGHIVCYMGQTDGKARILDNNKIQRYDYYPHDDWVRRWQRTSGCAFVIISGEAPPPVPEGKRV